MSDLCPSCKGSGAHTFSVRGIMQIWECMFCRGAGGMVQFGPAPLTRRKARKP